jgi:membrane associated rhomboid family serine protease
MIPIADENPRGFIPFINYLILAANIAIFIFVQPSNLEAIELFFRNFGLVPVEITHFYNLPKGIVNVFSSMFLHGGIMHLAGNMLYLWIFGDNIEYLIGHKRYLIFYLTVGIGAAALQIGMNPNSVVPMVGASGAISGVLGAYLIKFPKNRVSILFFFIIIIQVVRVPALIVLSFWFIFQLAQGTVFSGPGQEGGVAYFAHIGGFISGFVLIKLFEKFPK